MSIDFLGLSNSSMRSSRERESYMRILEQKYSLCTGYQNYIHIWGGGGAVHVTEGACILLSADKNFLFSLVWWLFIILCFRYRYIATNRNASLDVYTDISILYAAQFSTPKKGERRPHIYRHMFSRLLQQW